MRRFLLVTGTALLTACASGGGTQPEAQAGDALYQRMDAASERYRTGLEQIARGEADAGRSETTAAAAELIEAAGQCQALAGCDTGRFLAAYDALLAERALGADGDREGFAALEDEPEVVGESTGSPLVATLPAAQRTLTLLEGRGQIALNDPLKAALTEWLTWMRPQLNDAWVNYQFLRHQMWPEYERAGLPEALLFGILAKESAGKVHAVSRAGAAGPLQFMPATGLRFGLGAAGGFDTRFDPQLSARANVLYLNERFGELNHNLELALAAYNGGEGRVRRLYNGNGGKGFWDPQVYAQLPPETRDYVPMVLAAAWLFLHPADYGLEFPRVEAGESVILSLQRPASINELAICLGNADALQDGWFRVLRNLNPRYEAHTVIAAGTTLRVPPQIPALYRASCLDGARAQLAAELAAARKPAYAAPRTASAGTYTVKRGDTLHNIARRHGCTVGALARGNGLKAPRYVIRPGQRLRLSGCRG